MIHYFYLIKLFNFINNSIEFTMGCCKLIGEKKNNKISGQGNLLHGDTLGNQNFETITNIKDPAHKET